MFRFDGVWYGRAAAWIGGGLLLLMAATGRQVGIVSVAAVIAVFIGAGLLLYSIPGERIQDPWRSSSTIEQSVGDRNRSVDHTLEEEDGWR
jgi:membrane protein implicated in regulation of membrane protease activity